MKDPTDYRSAFLKREIWQVTGVVFVLRLLLIDDNKEITEAIGFYCKSAKDKDIDCQVINEGKEGFEVSEAKNLILLC